MTPDPYRAAWPRRWMDGLFRWAAGRYYPRSDGFGFIIGPDCFADVDACVVTWQGENYYRSSGHQ